MNEKIKEFQQGLTNGFRMWLNDPLVNYLNVWQGQELLRVDRYKSSVYTEDEAYDDTTSIEVQEKWVLEGYPLPKVYWVEYPEFISIPDTDNEGFFMKQYQTDIGLHVNHEGLIKRIDVRTKQIF